MSRRVAQQVLASVLLAGWAVGAQAQGWVDFGMVSSTLGINGGRLCVGDGTRGDFGCPAYAPNLTTAGNVSVTGNLSANRFVGDGSGLSNIPVGAVTVSVAPAPR